MDLMKFAHATLKQIDTALDKIRKDEPYEFMKDVLDDASMCIEEFIRSTTRAEEECVDIEMFLSAYTPVEMVKKYLDALMYIDELHCRLLNYEETIEVKGFARAIDYKEEN